MLNRMLIWVVNFTNPCHLQSLCLGDWLQIGYAEDSLQLTAEKWKTKT